MNNRNFYHAQFKLKSTVTIRFVLAFGLLISIQCSQKGEEVNPEMEFDADKIVSEWVRCWNTYNLNEVDRLFLQDSKLTYFSSEKQGVIKGFEAVRAHHVGFGFVKGGKEQPNKLWVEDLHASTFSNTAVVTGIWFFERPDGSRQRGPVTIIYVKINDDVRIAHMNFSNYLDAEKSS